MTRPNSDSQPFAGFTSPNYTPVPDELFDQLLPTLSGSELKALLYIIRRTFGFKREADHISLSQMLNGITTSEGRVLDQGTGIKDKKTLLEAINKLEAKNIILTCRRQSAARGNEPTTYRLNVRPAPPDGKSPPPLEGKSPQGGGGETPPSPWGENPPTQETGRQETDFDLSNFERPHDQEKSTNEASGEQEGGRSLLAPQTGAASERPPRPPLVPLGEILHRRQQAHASGGTGGAPRPDSGITAEPAASFRRRPPGSAEEREQLAAHLTDFARELGDEAPLSSTITRAVTIFAAANVAADRWSECLYQARAITQERTAQIRTPARHGEQNLRCKNKMPYFFAVLADLVEPSANRRPPTAPVVER